MTIIKSPAEKPIIVASLCTDVMKTPLYIKFHRRALTTEYYGNSTVTVYSLDDLSVLYDSAVSEK